jgi:hypothetical protein
VFINFSSRKVQRLLRLGALGVAVALPLCLWIGGAQPIAVGLVPAPWDKGVHAAVFGVLALAVGYASGWRGWRGTALGFAVAVAVGGGDEWHQLLLPGRSAGLDDLAADIFGAALGAWALLRLRA